MVVPRAYSPLLTRVHFGLLRAAFLLAARPSLPYAQRDRVMALYAPTALLLLPGLWVLLVLTGLPVLAIMQLFGGVDAPEAALGDKASGAVARLLASEIDNPALRAVVAL